MFGSLTDTAKRFIVNIIQIFDMVVWNDDDVPGIVDPPFWGDEGSDSVILQYNITISLIVCFVAC